MYGEGGIQALDPIRNKPAPYWKEFGFSIGRG
jgi:hypothetical protein